jgi:uncharacterized SAM-binding protein YcdF (DUF218 family)
MFHIISKIFTLFLMPFAWLFICLAIAFFTKSDKRRKTFVKVAFLILFIFGNTFLASKVMTWWEPKPLEIAKMRNYDVAIVLGGGIVNESKRPFDRTHFYSSADRLLQAFQLYKIGKVKKILISGGSASFVKSKNARTDATLGKDFLLKSGVLSSVILIENDSKNTYENALFTKKLLETLKLQNSRLLLITSAYHMNRGMACFKKQNLKIDSFPSSYKRLDASLLSFNVLVPDEESFSFWYDLFHEWFGLLTYKIMGYI